MFAGLLPLLSLLILLSANLAHAKMGFWPIDDEQIPGSVRDAASSTYQVFFPGTGSAPMKREDAKMSLRFSELSGTKSAVLTKLNQLELELCLRHPKMKECVLSTMPQSSTLFSLEDGRIATAAHAIKNYIQRVMSLPGVQNLSVSKKMDIIYELPIPVILREKNGKIHSVVLKINKILQQSLSSFAEYSDSSFGSDGLLMTIEKGFEVKQGLKFANAKVADTEIIYAVGVPGKTTDRSLLGVPDAAGFDMRVTFGPKLSLDQLISVIGGGEVLGPQDRDLLAQHVIAFYGDGYGGMSGGPILNKKGEVVGIFNGTKKFDLVSEDPALYTGVGLCIDLLVRKGI